MTFYFEPTHYDLRTENNSHNTANTNPPALEGVLEKVYAVWRNKKITVLDGTMLTTQFERPPKYLVTVHGF